MRKPTDKARELVENFHSFSLKWSTSRGRYTYGYRVCSLYLNRYAGGFSYREGSVNGGGYDMAGAVLGEWMTKFFEEDLKKLSAYYDSNTPWSWKGTFYGLHFYDEKRKKYRKTWRPGYKVWLDGACGFNCMERILYALGITLTYKRISAREDLYIFNLTTKKGR